MALDRYGFIEPGPLRGIAPEWPPQEFANEVAETMDVGTSEKKPSSPVADKKAVRRRKAATEKPSPFAIEDPWEVPVIVADVLDELVALIRQYVVLPKAGPEVVALWILHTYVVDVADYTPYLLVTSPVRECGKSTLLDLLVHLAFRAQQTGGFTAAVLYRKIDRLSPAMLLDELDTRLRGDSGEAIRGVLNTGFHRSGKMTICVGDNHDDKDFSTFCPKVLAGIGRVWDTVTSRSIPLRLARASKVELATLTKIRGDRISATCCSYRRRLLRIADDSREMLRIADPVAPEELSARQADVWRPLLAIAELAGDHWPETARSAALTLHGVAEEEGDLGLLLLADVRSLFEAEKQPVLTSKSLIDALTAMETRPWMEYRHGAPISTRGLSSLLGRFGIKPKVHRVGDATPRGYALAELKPIFDQYLPSLATPDESATRATRAEKIADSTDVAGVADRTDVTGQSFPCSGCSRFAFPKRGTTCFRCRNQTASVLAVMS